MIRRYPKTPGFPNQVLQFGGFQLGLNSSLDATQLNPHECSVLTNWTVKRQGKVFSRSPIKKYSDTAITGSVVASETVKIGTTIYTLLQGSDYKLYYLSTLTPTLIATLTDKVEILPYNGVAIILDGGFIKYMDDVSTVKICYDDGTTGLQFDHTAGSNDSSLPLGDGTNVRVAEKFTSQAWTAGYTIPTTRIFAYLGKTGSPTGDITANVRLVSDDSIIATETFVDVATLTTTAALFSVTFDSVTTEMLPGTDYYCSLEYSGGGATDYVNVHTVDQTGLSFYYTTAWVADATKDCLMSLAPGMPPKGTFGVVSDSSLFIGGDPDHPGWIWKSNLTHLDWSTTNGGGFIGVIDNNKNTYPVGAIGTLYGDLLVYGKEDFPYISKLSGTDASNYVLSLTFQQEWSTAKTLINCVNNLWAGSRAGVNPISGVREYGDLRTTWASDPVQDRLDDNWDSDTAFAGYYPDDGQYWLVMPSYCRVLVCNTRLPVGMDNGIRYPWNEYEFYQHDLSDPDLFLWKKSANGTNEYYVVSASGGDPGISRQPDFITYGGKRKTYGTVGSLSNQLAGYGDNDSLGFDTVYFADALGSLNSQLTNEMLNSNDLAAGAWWAIGTNVLSTTTGLDAAHVGTLITDDDTASEEWVGQDIAVLPSVATARFFPKKETSVVVDSVIGFYWSGDADEEEDVNFNSQTGVVSVNVDDSGTLAYQVLTSTYNSDYWEVCLSATPSNLSNTDITPRMDPSGWTATDTGALSVGNVELYFNNTIEDIVGTDPIYTEDSAVTVDKVDAKTRRILAGMIPTCFSKTGVNFFIGGSDGFLHTIDRSGYKDNEAVQISPVIKSHYTDIPLGSSVFNEFQVMASSKLGAQLDVNFFINGSRDTITDTKTVSLAMIDNITVDDLTMTVNDMLFAVDYGGTSMLLKHLNFNGNSIMFSIDNMKIISNPVELSGVIVRHRRLRY